MKKNNSAPEDSEILEGSDKGNKKTSSSFGKPKKQKRGPRIDQVFKVLGLTALMLLILLSPEIKKSYSDYSWESGKKGCFGNQKLLIEAVARHNKKNPDMTLGRGSLKDLIPIKPELKKFSCPANGDLKLEAVDLGSEMTVSCSIHGSKDRQADNNGKIEIPVMAGTFIYDAKIGRERADLVATFLIGTGFFNTPNARIDLSLVDNVYVIAFKINKVIQKGDEFYEKSEFYSEQISYEVLDGSPVEFALYPPNGAGVIRVRAKAALEQK